MIKGTATRHTVLEWDGSEEDLISLCDELKRRYDMLGMGLDSLDLGDSLGAIAELLEESDFDGMMDIRDERGHLVAYSEYDLFKWERIPD